MWDKCICPILRVSHHIYVSVLHRLGPGENASGGRGALPFLLSPQPSTPAPTAPCSSNTSPSWVCGCSGTGLGSKLRRVDRSQVSGCQMWQLHSQPCHSNHWGKRELSSPRRGFHSWFNLLLTFSKKKQKENIQRNHLSFHDLFLSPGASPSLSSRR